MAPNNRPHPPRMRDGAAAEDAAGRMLERHGLLILARNYRTKGGEIDIVAADGDALVFVEVRLRRNGRFGGAGASIDFRKQARIVRAARHFLLSRPSCPCRFDAVLVSDDGMEWIRDAFGV